MQHLLSFLTRFGEKIIELLHYPIVWISGFFLFVLDAVSGGKLIIYIVIIASVIDLICGIAVAIKRKSFARSDLMRQTVEKLLVYGLVLLVFLCIDHVIERETGFSTDLTSGLVGVVMTLTETWSFLASLLILYPDNPFLKFLQKYLIGELARKLGCNEDEVAAILAASREKQPRKKNGQFAPKKKIKSCNQNK